MSRCIARRRDGTYFTSSHTGTVAYLVYSTAKDENAPSLPRCSSHTRVRTGTSRIYLTHRRRDPEGIQANLVEAFYDEDDPCSAERRQKEFNWVVSKGGVKAVGESRLREDAKTIGKRYGWCVKHPDTELDRLKEAVSYSTIWKNCDK